MQFVMTEHCVKTGVMITLPHVSADTTMWLIRLANGQLRRLSSLPLERLWGVLGWPVAPHRIRLWDRGIIQRFGFWGPAATGMLRVNFRELCSYV